MSTPAKDGNRRNHDLQSVSKNDGGAPREEKGRRLSVDSSVRGGNGEPTLLRFQSLRAKATASNVSPGGWFRENCDM